MKIHPLVVTLLPLIAMGAANLNITPADDGSDMLWLSWGFDGDSAAVARYNGASMEQIRCFNDCPEGITSTLTEDPSGGLHLMMSKRYVLSSLNPSGAMTTEGQVNFDPFSEWWRPGLLRRSADPAWGLLGQFRVGYLSSGAEFYWITREYTVSETGVISLGDSLYLDDPWPLGEGGTDFPDDILDMTYPVMNGDGCPVMATRQALPGGVMPPTPSSLRIATQCHNTTASAVYLTADTLTWSTTDSPESRLMASGSCAAEAVFLWSDSTQTLYWSTHDCQTGVVSTAIFPGQGPWYNRPSAISANPVDPGMLLVWLEGSELLCRHYQSGWNDFAYVIQTGVPNLQIGNLAVCSTEPGYWVAWVTGASDPVVFFVDRDTVTGTASSEGSVEPLKATIHPNPSTGMLWVSVAGSREQFTVELFDNAGRRVATAGGSGTVTVTTEGLAPGCYLARITDGSRTFTAKTVIVR